MIPIMEQERPNILPRYRCGQCGTRFPLFSAKEKEWNYCCHCGAEIEWDKVKPIVWEEKQCSVCGKIMIRIDKDGHAYDNGNYVAWTCVGAVLWSTAWKQTACNVTLGTIPPAASFLIRSCGWREPTRTKLDDERGVINEKRRNEFL